MNAPTDVFPFGIDPLADSRKFMLADLARSGLVPSDFPFPPTPITNVGDKGDYQLRYSNEYYKLKIDRTDDKYVGLKGVIPPVVVFGEHYKAPITASVEGLKKALCFFITTGIPTIALDSCWGFGENVTNDAGVKVKDLHSDILKALYPGQNHLVLLDGDWATNDNVRLAMATYRMLLEEQGIKASFRDLGADENGKRLGYDDWFVARYGNDRVGWPDGATVLESAVALPAVPAEAILSGANSFALHNANRFAKEYLDLTHRGTGSLLIKLIGIDNFRFIRDLGEWVLWDNQQHRWKNLGKSPLQLVNQATLYYLNRAEVLSAQAAKVEGTKVADMATGLLNQAKHFRAWATQQCSSHSGCSAILRSMELSRPELWSKASMFDNQPHLLGVANGVVDLRTGELRKEKQEDFILRHAPTTFSETEPPSTFTIDGTERNIKTFLTNMTGHPRDSNMISTPDPELAAYHQTRTGAMLWGTNALQGFDIWAGPPATAKSTLLQIIRATLGNTDENGYYAHLSPGVIMSATANRDPESATPVLIRALGARIVGMSESKDTQVINETLIKQMSGDLSINGRANYHDALDIKNTFNIILICNDLPAFNTADTAFLERVVVTPFDVRWRRDKIELSDDDKNLPHGDKWWIDHAYQHETVQQYTLWWLVQGCKNWHKEGKLPKTPQRIIDQLQDYVKENDVFIDWMSERNWTFDNDTSTLSGDIYRSFKDWMECSGRRPPNNKAFSKRLLKRFPKQLKTHKGTGNTNHIWGIRLLETK